MRCKTCDYSLWNLKARQCPECGAEFRPSQFEFTRNTIQFCCPHCQQAYYGTSERGHLEPSAFVCVTCNQQITMDEMVLRPREGVRDEQTQINRMPWLERKQRGFFRAVWQTTGAAMSNPGGLARAIPAESSVGAAWWFGIVAVSIYLVIGIGLPLAAFSAFMYATQDRSAPDLLWAAGVTIISTLVGFIIGVAIWGAIAHGLLRLTGKVEHGIGRTYQALLYSTGTLAILAIPCIGPYCTGYVLWIWWAIAAIFMVMQMQQVHGGRATFAVLVFPAAFIALVVSGYMWFIFSVIGGPNARMGGNFAAAPTTVAFEMTTIGETLNEYAAAHNGMGPPHALYLTKHGILASNFISASSNTVGSDISIGDITFDQFDFLPSNYQTGMIEAAAKKLPEDVVAHRCGDFVLTCHGIDWLNAHPDLWTAIYWPDPDANPFWRPALAQVNVATVQQPHVVLRGEFDSLLTKQNQLRAQYQLPPLPHPSKVTHDGASAPSP